MKLRNVLSLSLAAVAALSIGTTAAFATATGEENILPEEAAAAQEHELTSRMYSPTILVQVSGERRVYVNPTEATITETLTDVLDASEDEEETKDVKYSIEDQGVVSTPIFIRSDTTQALEVNATVTLASDTITIMNTDDTFATGEKQAKVQIKGAKTSKTADEIRQTMESAANKALGISFFDNTAVAIKSTAAALGEGVEPELPQVVNAVAKVAAVTPDNEGHYVPQYTGLLLTGEVSANPSTPWDANDTISARIVLSFSGTK